jgi:DNA-binding winged helix-turn-helix (wHTH) protein/tetratricopeptide (TPR) repeat protein
MEKKTGFIYDFDSFRVDPLNRRLVKDGHPVPLTPLAFHTLLFLIENKDRLVSRTELLTAIWPDTFVDDPNLAVMISVVRKALGDSGHAQKYIETVAKSGYRFVAQVHKEIRIEPDTVAPAEAPAGQVARGFNIERVAFALVIVSIVGGVFFIEMRSPETRSSSVKTASKRASTSELSTFRSASILNGPGAVAEPEGEAHAWYLKGRYCWSRGGETGLKQSIVYFRNAIAEDPRNALAYAGLADAYQSLATWSVESSDVSYREAKKAADRAVNLDDSLSQSHSAIGMIAMVHDWNFTLAKKEFLRAVELGPNDAIAHQRLGTYLAATGKLQEALMEMRRARDLDPLSLNIGIEVGRMLFYSRQYPEAMAEYRKVIDLDPHYSVAHYYLGMAFLVQRDFKNAILELGESSRLVNNREPLALGLYAAARAGDGDELTPQSVLAELRRRSLKEYISPLSIGLLYLHLGQPSQAMDWIEKMFRDHIVTSIFSEVDPLFDPLRNNPRFLALSRSVRAKSDQPGPLISRLASH